MRNSNPNICVYCNINPASKSEHVFCKSLGGEDVFMDCVCTKCNQDFSLIERELLQNPIIALARSAEGVEGYNKNKKRPATLRQSEIFSFDEKNKIVYEVGSYKELKSFRRPQIIRINGNLYLEGPDEEDARKFISTVDEWAKNSLIIAFKTDGKPQGFRFKNQNGVITYEKVNLPKIRREIFCITINQNHKYAPHLEPRLFFDDQARLILRCRNLNEACDFVIQLLNKWLSPNLSMDSFGEPDNNVISVSSTSSISFLQRALAKIGLNCLMHCFPETQNRDELKELKEYILHDMGGIKIHMLAPKYPIIDDVKGIHYVLFTQLKKGLMIRVGLFNYMFTNILISDWKLFAENGTAGLLEINYVSKRQTFLSLADFIHLKNVE